MDSKKRTLQAKKELLEVFLNWLGRFIDENGKIADPKAEKSINDMLDQWAENQELLNNLD